MGNEAVESGSPLDVLFCQAGTVRMDPRWPIQGGLPERLPAAREYWLVYRIEARVLPPRPAWIALAAAFAESRREAQGRGLNVVGMQIDFDSPTAGLAKYAVVLRELKRSVGSDTQLSITALLDWFRAGTAFGEVAEAVDEFVPQFYDTGTPPDGGSGEWVIATPFTAATWGPIFNRYNKRYRIGISTFGRARRVSAAASSSSQDPGYIGDVTPLQFGRGADFEMDAHVNAASELLLRYTAKRPAQVGYAKFDRGDGMEFVLTTPESIRRASAEARRMGGYCGGMLFFRWTGYDEILTAQPGEALAAAAVDGRPLADRPPALETSAGNCAAVVCTDLFLLEPNAVAAGASHYRFDSTGELEYFVPREGMPARLTGPNRIEMSLPPYTARGRMYLGRAVSAKPVEFKIAKEKR